MKNKNIIYKINSYDNNNDLIIRKTDYIVELVTEKYIVFQHYYNGIYEIATRTSKTRPIYFYRGKENISDKPISFFKKDCYLSLNYDELKEFYIENVKNFTLEEANELRNRKEKL